MHDGTALDHLRAEVIEIEALARATEAAADALLAPANDRQRMIFGRVQSLITKTSQQASTSLRFANAQVTALTAYREARRKGGALSVPRRGPAPRPARGLLYAPPVDYDTTDIAATYDLGRDHGPTYLDLWMRTVGAYVHAPRTILDLGCGTGRFSNALAAYFDAELVGVDPSTKMLEQARRKPTDRRVRYQSGRGEAIPLPDGSIDLVFMSMIFHHVSAPALLARECRRVLRPAGTMFLRGAVREQLAGYPDVPFFPAAVPILERMLPPASFVRDTFEAAGFRTLAIDIIRQEVAPSFDAYAVKIATRADSVLASLEPADFDAGMAALRAHAARTPGVAVLEPVDVFVFRSDN